MIINMLINKKLNQVVTALFIQRQKNKHFFCFYLIILFCSTKKYQVKFYALFYYENSKKKGTSTRLYESFQKCNAKPYSVLVIDATLTSDNLLRFKKNHLERIQKLIITNDVRLDMKYVLKRKAAKPSVLSPEKLEKYEYLIGEEILPCDKRK